MDDYQVKPNTTINLEDWNPNDKRLFDFEKQSGKLHLVELNNNLMELQNVLYAEHKHKVLFVLQGMDTSGKDGTIKMFFGG